MASCLNGRKLPPVIELTSPELAALKKQADEGKAKLDKAKAEADGLYKRASELEAAALCSAGRRLMAVLCANDYALRPCSGLSLAAPFCAWLTYPPLSAISGAMRHRTILPSFTERSGEPRI